MKSKINSALCSKCSKGQIIYKTKKLCSKCYKNEWGNNYYQNHKKKLRKRSRLWQREKKRKLGKRLPRVDNLWANEYDCCVSCGTTEKEHTDHGLCTICKDKSRYPKRHKKYLKKLYTDKEFHEKELEKFREYNHKQYIENPEKVLERCKKYYYNNKDKISKKNKLNFAKERKKLRKEKTFFCEECNKRFEPYALIGTSKNKFCSGKCSMKNWNRLNKEINKAKARINLILNNKRKKEYDKEFRIINKNRKKETDYKYYILNYPKIRNTSRTKEILSGNFPHDNKNFEKIMERDIELLRNKIKEKEEEIEKINSRSKIISNLIVSS